MATPLRRTFVPGAIALLFSASPLAEERLLEGLTANAGFTNNYLWRAITQTNDGPAISGGLDYGYSFFEALGIYAGLWLSNVDFGGPDDPQYELDLYAGLDGSFGHFGYDAGYIAYLYPDDDGNIDFSELYLGGSWRWFSAMVYKIIDREENAPTTNAWYYIADFVLPLKNNVAVKLEVGTYRGSGSTAGVHYWHYGAYVSKDEFSLGIIQTDVNSDNGQNDPILQVSWTREYDL